MTLDKITLKDLSVFPAAGLEEHNLFELIDHTTTQAGREQLRKHLLQPPGSLPQLAEVQDTVKFFVRHPDLWPSIILNGTIVMLESYFESADSATVPPGGFGLLIDSMLRRVIAKKEHSLQQFSLLQVSDFLKGCQQLAALTDLPDCPDGLKRNCDLMKAELDHALTVALQELTGRESWSVLAKLDFQVRRQMKSTIRRLITCYSLMDMWHAMAVATTNNKWIFPELATDAGKCFTAEALMHPLVLNPTPYDVSLSGGQNFLILTGANMSGKTTLLRAVGVAALLAHLGMGVPAQRATISYLGGINTNMHVEDNISRGESYFLAEVLRMKNTALKLAGAGTQLVLLDELFKGTNVLDAYECTRAVIEGLLHRKDHLFIISTHLYEVARQFENDPAIRFAYFETTTDDEGQYRFTYRLRDGISNDRIGYRILQRHGVTDLLRGI